MKTSKYLLLSPRKPDLIDGQHIGYITTQPHMQYEVPPSIVYHYTSIDKAKLILKNRNLKFSSPTTFNDPFDMYEGLVDFSCTTKSMKAWVRDAYEDASEKKRRELIQSIKKDGLEGFRKTGLESFLKRKRDSGVCCFSEKSDVSLMWSHYADKHEGICLGFDFHPVGKFGPSSMTLWKVNYIDKIEPINCYSRRNEAINYWLYSKSKVWEYEKEVRAFINERENCDLFTFSRACLKEIYFGCRTNPSAIEAILNMVDEQNYQLDLINKMILDDEIFNIRADSL